MKSVCYFCSGRSAKNANPGSGRIDEILSDPTIHEAVLARSNELSSSEWSSKAQSTPLRNRCRVAIMASVCESCVPDVFQLAKLIGFLMPRPPREDDFIVSVARMRYEEGRQQNEIAEILGLGKATISRALKDAVALGFVEIRVAPQAYRKTAIERALVQRLGLKAAVVVALKGAHDETQDGVGAASAMLLEEQLSAGAILGIGEGTELASMARSLKRSKIDIDVVAMIGSTGLPEDPSSIGEITRTVAANLSSRAWIIAAPALLDDADVASALMRQPRISSLFNMLERMTHAVVGISTISSISHLGGMLTAKDVGQLRAAGAVGSICGRFIGTEGQPVSNAIDSRTFAVPMSALKRASFRMAVCTGVEALQPLAAAIRGQLVNAIAVDEGLARGLLDWPADASPSL